MMALSGVRSSWDMLARNYDLCRLAASSSRPVFCTRSNNRVLSIASTDWLANVWSRSTSGCGYSPGGRGVKPSLRRFGARRLGLAALD